jgi:hypothetical protein
MRERSVHKDRGKRERVYTGLREERRERKEKNKEWIEVVMRSA